MHDDLPYGSYWLAILAMAFGTNSDEITDTSSILAALLSAIDTTGSIRHFMIQAGAHGGASYMYSLSRDLHTLMGRSMPDLPYNNFYSQHPFTFFDDALSSLHSASFRTRGGHVEAWMQP